MTTADSLQIAGMRPLSTVDWPRKLAAVLFLQGCPWRCPYCHNFEILDPQGSGQVPWSDVRGLLERRRGLLDGLVFSGGEALRQPAVLPAAAEVKELGFAVGLHTAGVFPRALERMLSGGLVDWVGLDIKALPSDYGQSVGQANGEAAAAKAAESLRLVVNAAVDYEVRLTLHQGGLEYALEVARWCQEQGVTCFALQRLQVEHVPGGFVPEEGAQDWDADVARSELNKLGFDSLTIRS